MKRRKFIKKLGLSTALVGTGSFPLAAMQREPEITKITLLHTNDVHSRIDPFPMDGGRYQGLGGTSKRAAIIEKIRTEEEHVLLLDAGDIFQGTPYFNYYGGEVEFKLMSEMRYDASTIGNHDFDAGIDGLYKQLPHAKFPFLSCNYNFSDTCLHDKVLPYKIFKKDSIKIGVLGVGIELEGLVPTKLYGNTQYLHPIEQANLYANRLRNDMNCDFIICLSHLGLKYSDDKVSDIILAKETKEIDLIIGGHTHTFLEKPEIIVNKIGKEVTINQVGWAGIILGRLDVYFERNYKKRCVTCKNLPVR